MIYPFSKNLREALKSYPEGNFGLWFNKLVPVDESDSFAACNLAGNTKNVVEFYKAQYDRLARSKQLKNQLAQKHQLQKEFCADHKAVGYKAVEIKATLQSPLITGIGQTHPNEVGMTFDHTLGLPYLPATGIKGLVRLGHILNLINNEKMAELLINGEELDDTHSKSLIPFLFGGDCRNKKKIDKLRGQVIFLDAYSEKVPELTVDIMNPHYGDYYFDEKNKTPPGDYLDPKPIKFLALPSGQAFIFRAVLPKDNAIVDAFIIALSELGFGAKTAIGYGRFKIDEELRAPKGHSKTDDAEQEPSKDPQDKIEAALKQFKSELPNSVKFPGQAMKIVDGVKNQEKQEIKKAMCKVLVEYADRLPKKNKFSKALKLEKKWAISLMELCKMVGIEIR